MAGKASGHVSGQHENGEAAQTKRFCRLAQKLKDIEGGFQIADVAIDIIVDRAIALQSPIMSVRRNSLLQPGLLNLPRFEPLSVLALMMPGAMRRSAAKLAGALSLRAR